MKMIGRGLRIFGGAAIFAAVIYVILSVPGFLSDRDSTVPPHLVRGDPPASAAAIRRSDGQRDKHQREALNAARPHRRTKGTTHPSTVRDVALTRQVAPAGRMMAKASPEPARLRRDVHGTGDARRDGCRYAAGSAP
jgi:hypothetical protein